MKSFLEIFVMAAAWIYVLFVPLAFATMKTEWVVAASGPVCVIGLLLFVVVAARAIKERML